jgi:predicted acyltransferase
MRLPWKVQLGVSLFLLLLTEILYRSYDPAAPFVKDQNFGAWFDILVMGKINNGGGWVTINCLPTAAHTIWGALCGKVLMDKTLPGQKIKLFLISGLLGLLIGYGLHFAGLTPIIKRISTSSFVFAAGGWAILMLAFFYWLVDVKGIKSWTTFFMIVGSNSIFIYLFAETIGHQWLTGFASIWTEGLLTPLGMGTGAIAIFSGVLTLGIMWYLCYFLYRKGIFFKV